MTRVERKRPLAASLLLCLAFGSLHAYGVLLLPLEAWLGASRTITSLGYSVAIIFVTAGVMASAGLRRRFSPRQIALLCGLCAGAGLGLAASGVDALSLLAGYGVMFGAANGVAYSLSLHEAAASAPRFPGWAMGLATAVYGAGSVLASQALAMLLAILPVQMVLIVMGAAMVLACCAAALLLGQDARQEKVAAAASAGSVSRLWLAMLWLIYFLGASGGLMVIAHSAAIIAERAADGAQTAAAPILVGLGSIAGGYFGGVMTGKFGPKLSLLWPLLCLSAALPGLWWFHGEAASLTLMLVCGMGYGILISVIPAVIQQSCGAERFASLFGMVFTAWGLAGLCGPAVAGLIFDRTASYDAAILLAFAVAAAGAVLSLLLPKLRIA